MFHAMLHTLLMARLHFCEDNVIAHFFCDMSALLKLSCSDTRVNELVIFITGGLILVIPFLLIITSYARIVSSTLKLPSARGIRKAFSTCGSHLTVVSLFYGTVIGLYLCPSANNSTVKETVMAMIYWRQSMTGRNQTTVSEFLLLGLPIESEHQNLFYALFLAIYRKQNMTGRNETTVSEFLLLGLPIKSEHQNLFYALFLAI
ncbi:hypothetical protein AB1E18_014223 [Capra hircus]